MKCSDYVFPGILHFVKDFHSARCVLLYHLNSIFCAIIAHIFVNFHQSEFARAHDEHIGFFILQAGNVCKGQVVGSLSPPIPRHSVFLNYHVMSVLDSVYDHLSELVAFDSHKSSQIKWA